MSLEQISNSAISEDVLFEISRGTLPGFTAIVLPTENLDVGTTIETIWPEGGLRPYPAAATKMTISSDDAADNTAGTGARLLKIIGLDASWNWITESIIPNGLTGVETEKEYLRINCIFVLTAGSTEASVGTLYIGTGTITAGKPAIVYSLVPNGGEKNNRSLDGAFAIPYGYRVLVPSIVLNTGKAQDVQTGIYIRPFGSVFQVAGKQLLYQNNYIRVFPTFPNFPAKTDLEFRAKSSLANAPIIGSAFIILERIDKSVPFILPGTLEPSATWVVPS